MVKNEQKRILQTLHSFENVVDGMVIYDTGSEDDTISIIKNFKGVDIDLIEGKFEDFATSRNVLLKYARESKKYDYVFLLDCNEEYRIRDVDLDLRKLLKENSEMDGFYVDIKLYVGEDSYIDFSNVKLIKLESEFEYVGPVHEYIKVPEGGRIGKLKEFFIFQNRLEDDDKTRKRWHTDKILLEKEYSKDPSNPRTQYYLAQTYDCLQMRKEAKDMYSIRYHTVSGFQEERFNAALKAGDLTDDVFEKISWYLRSFDVMRRVEPMVRMSRIFRKKEEYELAYAVSNLACELSYPHECILWVEKKCYEHDRWQELCISSYHVKEYEKGKAACTKALDSGYEKETNEKNLTFFQHL